MVGNLVLLFLTWALLRYEGRSLTAIGLNRPRRRLLEFVCGFVLLGAMQAARYLAWGPVGDFHWVAVSEYGLPELATVMWLLLKAVLYEELLFRGYLLLLAIRWLGVHRGVLLSAAVFGAYHWFSYGVSGGLVQMLWVFLLTGAAGLLFGYAFARSGSILLPVGLHLGNNAVSTVVFSDGPWGAQWLVPSQPPSDPGLLTNVLLNFLFPVVFTGVLSWILVRFYRPDEAFEGVGETQDLHAI